MIPIDFNKPVDRLDDVLFDVQLKRLYASPDSADLTKSKGKELPNYRLVCNKGTGKVLSIVSKNYKLISNKEALEMGMDLFQQLFPKVKTNELVVFRIVAPKSLVSAHIDLIHKDVNFEVWKQDSNKRSQGIHL